MTTGVGLHASMGNAALAVKDAVYAQIKTALADAGEVEVDLSYGFRWPARWDDLVAVTAVRADPGEGALGRQRRREITVSVDVNLIAWAPTDDEQVTHARAFGLLDVIDRSFRAEPTLGGAALWCLLGEVTSDGATDDDDAGHGRITEIAATFDARVIVTN